MTVYCAYCGKSFTRKEHLERHIPQHTNVKPHRCGACQLSFARRDLLQRHFTTYHEARDPMEPLPGGIPTVAGRTPIACQNCANAKTGCDKKVPCTRCAEKNLACEARFARRSSKAAIRAAQAGTALQSAVSQSPQQGQPGGSAGLAFLEMRHNRVKSEGNESRSSIEVVIPGDHNERESAKRTSPHHSRMNLGEFPAPHTRLEGGGMDDFMHIGNDFAVHDAAYQDLLVWPEFQMDLDAYPNSIALARPDLSMPVFTDLSNASPQSDLVTASCSSSRGSIHTPGTSIMSSDFDNALKPLDFAMATPTDSSIPEFEVVIAAEEAWNLARCNPPTFTGNCPRTAIVHLECLEQKCKQEGTWSSLEKFLEQIDWDASDLTSVVPLGSRTRDKMLAITQSFLHKALETHRGGLTGYAKSAHASPGDFNFIVLPPSKILEYFLRSYVRSLSVYYPLVNAGCVDPNEMLQNNQASTLLVLLMIAQGAATMPLAEARYLSAGLTETCRISLFDIVEKDVELSADPTTLRCALLFLVLGAWSGDKWLMDIAMGQRGMYMSMLKHAGMLEPQPSMISSLNDSTTTELQWRVWVERETRNRLVYNYVMLDQELSLFHDTAPLFAITELQCPLPAPEVLWMSANSDQWFSAMQSLHNCTANVNPQLLSAPSTNPSLHELFQDFLQDKLAQRQPTLSPQQLRLILHPLQALICHLRQMLSCFSDMFSTPPRASGCSVTRASILHRLEEVQALLQKWYDVTMAQSKANNNSNNHHHHHSADSDCPVTLCNLVLYHLVSLNAVADVPEIERFARREGGWEQSLPLPLRHAKCIFQRQKAVFHCGQVCRLLRLMPPNRRPAWWCAAMYRAAMVLWMDSVATAAMDMDPAGSRVDKLDSSSSSSSINSINSTSTSSGGEGSSGSTMGGTPPQSVTVPVVMVDQLAPEDSALIAYLWGGGGVPVLTGLDGNGSTTTAAATTMPTAATASIITLDKPGDVLGYAVQNIETCFSSRVGDGIKRKLVALGNHWNVEVKLTSLFMIIRPDL
ncbi:hypothetical protein N658DRAFT_545682 [Parathielavia hyrcaniae]|uniref:Uncharacterized protein n=1 Tax=Parathielavia hyrcaniae TaxID=113614 RepID=A0AAN6T4S2_9PEZI|nr:hypothetical protein N658DRAFT_545682 [Parathielavia hyrcaniae]